MSIYQEFLTKKHKTRPICDFRELVYESEKDFSSLPAFVLREKTVTYSDLANDYRALCTALISNGYSEKRIAVIGANSYGWILAYLASATVGVAVPVDKELSPEELESRLTEEAFISEAFVLGVPNAKGGLSVKAKIFPCIEKIREIVGKLPTEEEIRKEIEKIVARVNEKLPNYKKIITEIVWEAFEKTTTKKIKRFGRNAI